VKKAGGSSGAAKEVSSFLSFGGLFKKLTNWLMIILLIL
jgi:hypothetical protein